MRKLNIAKRKSMSDMKSSKTQGGFTLIEIAIVLVIIGLLLGGVLQGQQLIENSRVRSATNSLNGLAAAVFSYQDRYGRLPGDDPGAITTRGASWPRAAAVASQGNGVITSSGANAFNPAATDEVSFFFQDLRSAGFIQGDSTLTGANALPANPFGGLMTVETAGALSDGTNAMAGLKICMGNVSGSASIALDTQLDDASPNSGRLRASADAGVPNTVPAATAAATYTEDLTYTICYRI